MTADARPALVAYDGSQPAQLAVRAAAELFTDRPLLVVSVWEPGLAIAAATARDPTGLSFGMMPTAEDVLATDRAQHDRAAELADEGAGLAREHGASAMALPVPGEEDPAQTICHLADEHGACAIVVGSRGAGAIASKLFGSVSRALLERSTRPVVVVRAETEIAGEQSPA